MRLIRAVLIMLALLLPAMPAPAQAPSATPGAGAVAIALLQPEIDTSSPRATYESFFRDLRRIGALYLAYRTDRTNERQYALFRAMQRLGTRVFDLSDLPPATRVKHTTIALGYMADILLRLPPVPPDEIPGTPPTAAADLPESWIIPGTEIRLQRRTEGPWKGQYAFSTDTVQRLPEFHAEIIGAPVLRGAGMPVLNWRAEQLRFTGTLLAGIDFGALPRPLQADVLGAPLWKSLLSLLVLLLAGAVARRVVRRVRRRAAALEGWRAPATLLLAPLAMVLATIACLLAIGWELGLAGPLFDAVIVLATLTLYAAAAWAAWLACDLVVEAIIALPTIPDDSYDANLLRLLARVASVVAVVAILMYGASQVGVPALSLLAGVSVGGIALALAAQSTVENLFGGISIFADRPFRVGDQIQGPSVMGTVERVGPRSSRIRGADGTLTTVPNSDLAKMHVTNVTARNGFLFKHLVRLSGDSTRAQVEALLEELRARVAAEERVKKAPGLPRVRLVGFGESSIDVEVFAQVPVATTAEFLEVQEGLVLEIMRAVEAGGLRFTFATPPVEPSASVHAHA